MDKIVFYLTVFSICGLVIIGGNYFLTDDVGNFSMEKAKNLVPNIAEAFVEKKNEITGTRDINKDMVAKKEAERLNIEGPVATIEHLATKPITRDSVRDSITKQYMTRDSVTRQYMTEMNALEINNVTSFQKEAMLKEIQDKYLGKKFHWSGVIINVKEYNGYILLTMRPEDDDYRWNILFCEMALNEFNRMNLRNIKKNDDITITGNYKRSDEDPWIKDCVIWTRSSEARAAGS